MSRLKTIALSAAATATLLGVGALPALAAPIDELRDRRIVEPVDPELQPRPILRPPVPRPVAQPVQPPAVLLPLPAPTPPVSMPVPAPPKKTPKPRPILGPIGGGSGGSSAQTRTFVGSVRSQTYSYARDGAWDWARMLARQAGFYNCTGSEVTNTYRDLLGGLWYDVRVTLTCWS